jgi:hypothetical protein
MYRVSYYYLPCFTRWFLDIKQVQKVIQLCTPRAPLKSYRYSNFNFHSHTLNTVTLQRVVYKKGTNKRADNRPIINLYFITSGDRNGLHVYRHTSQFWVKNKLECVRRFRVYSLFELQTLEFNGTVRLFYHLYWHRPLFSNIHTEEAERIQVKWACRPGNWRFTSSINLASSVVLAQRLTHFTTAVWWCTYLWRLILKNTYSNN